MLVLPMKRNVPKIDVFSTLESLSVILNIFSMSCVSRDGAKLKYTWSTWKVSFFLIFFFVINAFTIYYKIYSFKDNLIVITFRDSFELVYLFGYKQYIVDLIFVYKFGRQSYLDYLSLYDYIDSLINMPYNVRIKKYIQRISILFAIVDITTITLDYMATTINFGWLMPNLYLIDYVYFSLRMLSVLDTISNCIQINYRLKTIGDILESYYCNSDNLPCVTKDVVKEEINIKFHHYNFEKDVRQKRFVKNLSRSYLLLIEQNNYINTMYGFRIMLNSLLYLLDIVMLLNMIIRLILRYMVSPNTAELLLIISSATRLAACSLVIFSGTFICEKSYKQIERICRILMHLFMNKRIPHSDHIVLVELKDLINSKPIKYHVMNFYSLEYPTLVSLTSIIVTYTVILLQSIK